MKRMHVHVSVEDLKASAVFYTALFGEEPTVLKGDYAKWMLDDPCLNFAISHHHGAKRGIEHIGIQADTPADLAQVSGRIKTAGGAVFEEGEVSCCYAQSTKTWTQDPDGVPWEAFLTGASAEQYGHRFDPETVRADPPSTR